MPITSSNKEIYTDEIRYSERGFAQNKLEFDPTGGLGDSDGDDDDPFAKMQREREQSIKIRMSTAELSDETRTSSRI